MALVGYLTQLLFSSLGLAKDAALDAVGTYARLVKRALGYALVVGFIGLMLIIGGATYQQPHIMAAGIVVFTVLAIAIIFLSLPLVELTAYAVELGVAKRTLRLAGIVSGWLLIVSLVAYTSPADSSLFTRVLISALAFVPSYLLFGREATRTVLGTKLAVVLAAMAFGMLLPRTSAVMTT